MDKVPRIDRKESLRPLLYARRIGRLENIEGWDGFLVLHSFYFLAFFILNASSLLPTGILQQQQRLVEVEVEVEGE